MGTVFDFDSYTGYLAERLPIRGVGRGQRTILAQRLSCRPTFVSQVIRGKSHFSLEQAAQVNEFLLHSESEAEFFFHLVLADRAGGKALSDQVKRTLHRLRARRKEISSRVQAKQELVGEQAVEYFSHWSYSAVHMALLIAALRTPKAIGLRLRIAEPEILKRLEFLESVGLASSVSGQWKTSGNRLHIPKGSPHVRWHHSQWRLKAIEAASNPGGNGLHYSGVLALPKSEVETIRKLLFKLIEDVEPLLHKSAEEELVCLNLDLFEP